MNDEEEFDTAHRLVGPHKQPEVLVTVTVQRMTPSLVAPKESKTYSDTMLNTRLNQWQVLKIVFNKHKELQEALSLEQLEVRAAEHAANQEQQCL